MDQRQDPDITVTVIVPSAGGETLGRCLGALQANPSPEREIIVVDDSREGTLGPFVQRAGCRAVRTRGCEGAAAARNRGAREARGGVLVFIDDDVLVPRTALESICAPIAEGRADAVVGTYGVPPPEAGTASAYKHLWVMWSYLASPEEIDWVFASAFGVRRSLFEKAGGFDERRPARTGTDDLEMGMRLHAAGARIVLDKALRTVHLKDYTIRSLLENQFVRSRSFTSLARARRRLASSAGRGFANVPPSFIAGVALSWVLPPALLAAAAAGGGWWCAPAAVAAMWALTATPFVRFAGAYGGARRGLAAAPLTYIDHLVCGAGVLTGVFDHAGSGR